MYNGRLLPRAAVFFFDCATLGLLDFQTGSGFGALGSMP